MMVIYADKPSIINTNLTRVERDTYLLSLETTSGVFCLFNGYQYKRYMDKVYGKVKKFANKGKINVPVVLYYHEIKDAVDCKGEVENIRLR